MKRLFTLLTSIMLMLTCYAQETAKVRLESMAPVIAQSFDGDALVNLHEDETVSMLSVAGDDFVTSFYKAGLQGPIVGAETPAITTTWCDKKGVTHTVRTPIDSSTPAGIDRAVELHDKLVARMQQKHPPAPCPPPPAP